MLGWFNTARDHILVRRQSSGRFELARKVIGAEMNGGSHSLQRQTAFEIFHDVLDDRAELPARKYAVRRVRPPRTRGMTDQVNGQHSVEWLAHQRAAAAPRSQICLHNPHLG